MLIPNFEDVFIIMLQPYPSVIAYQVDKLWEDGAIFIPVERATGFFPAQVVR